MIIVRGPRTNHLFHPYTHAPSIAYWLLQPDTPEHEHTKTSTSNGNNNKANEGKEQQQAVTANNKEHTTIKPLFPMAMSDFDISEEGGHYVLSTDLPGVKLLDLKVEFKDSALQIEAERKKGTTAQTFLRKLAVDEDSVDVANFTATLADGILTLKAPKKNNNEDGDSSGERKIVLTNQEAPDVATELNLEVDLPGIKAQDVQITLAKDGMLMINAERKRRGSDTPTRMTEAYMLNTRKVDSSKLEAYLADGVLTIRAPAKPRVAKVIAVNGKLPPPKVEDVTKEDEEQNVEEKKEH